MKIGLAQTAPAWESPKKNLLRISRMAEQACGRKCDLLVLPEMCTTGYSIDASLAEPLRGPTVRSLSSLAQRFGIYVIAGFPARLPGSRRPFNLAAVFDRQGRMIAGYRKIRPFCLAGEDRVFAAGDSAVIFEVDCVPASVFICYDLRFPELFRSVSRDTEIVFVIANWPASRSLHWKTLLRARAIENQCYVAAVNRVGRDANGLEYRGESMVIDPFGKTLRIAGRTEGLFTAQCSAETVRDIRARYPFLADIAE